MALTPAQVIAAKEWFKEGGNIAVDIDCPDDEMIFIRSRYIRVMYCSPKTLEEFKQVIDDANWQIATTDVKRLLDER